MPIQLSSILNIMANVEILQIIKMKNIYVVRTIILISVVSVTVWKTISILSKKKTRKDQNKNDQIILIPLIVITGCDTGLGYSVVMRYLNDGHSNENRTTNRIYNLLMFKRKQFIVPTKIAIVAFCLNPNGAGAKRLHQLSVDNNKIKLFVKQLDLTNTDSIKNCADFISDLLQQNVDENGALNKNGCFKYELHAFVNNAARMVMAEYEWQTIQMIQQQFNINVLGPIMLTAQLLPKFRKDKSRVINIISHCAYLPLPGISIYGATKAAIRAWTVGSRVELENHGIRLITFSPGSFYLYSSIMSGQQRLIDFKQMQDQMNSEQLAYYGSYFDAYQLYLSSIDTYIQHPETSIPNDYQVYSELDQALWAAQPKAEYNVPEPWRYKAYFTMAWILSAFGLHHVRDKVVRRFVATPQFKNDTN